MGKINFKPGEFITHLTMPNCFAIYGGEELPSTDGDNGPKDYTLICYCNLSKNRTVTNPVCNMPQVNNIINDVFEADIDDKLCQYVLSEKDSFWWRRCNSDEKFKALKTLAEKYNLAWDDKTMKLRHLGPNEKLMSGDDTTNKPATRKKTEHVPNRMPLLGTTRVSHVSHKNNNETTMRLNKTVITIVPKSYKQAKKICGQNDDMVKSLAFAASEVNRKEALSYSHCYNSTDYGRRSPMYYGRPYDCYDEFWGD